MTAVKALLPNVGERQLTIAKLVAQVLIAVILIAALWALYQKVSGGADKVKVKPSPYRPGGGNVSDEWLADRLTGYVSDLDQAFKGTWFWQANIDRCYTLKRVHNELNDNQLVAVHNAFAKSFKTTIRRKLANLDDGCGFGTWSLNGEDEYGKLLLGRLNKLSLP